MKRNYSVLIFFCCALTILTQVIYTYVPGSDSIRYIQLARQYFNFRFFDPELNCYGHQFYAFFLALFGGFIAYNHYIIGCIQTLFFCLSAIFLIQELEYFYNKKLFGLAVILFLVPEIHFYNGYLLTESLAFTMLLLVFGLAMKINNGQSSISQLLLISLVVGFTLMHRVECGVVMAAIIYLIYPKIKEKLFLNSSVLLSFPLCFLLLVGIINYKTYHVFKLTSFNGGEVVYGGNNPALDGSHHCFDQHISLFIPKENVKEFIKIQSLPAESLYPKRDSLYIKMAWNTWKDLPTQQLGVIPDKLAKDWLLPGFFDIYTADISKTRGLQFKKLMASKYFKGTWYAPYKHLFYMIIHWALLLLILWGICYAKRKNRFQMAVLIVLVFFVLFAVPFCGLPRWHVPIFPLLIIAFMPNAIVDFVEKNLEKIKFKKLT